MRFQNIFLSIAFFLIFFSSASAATVLEAFECESSVSVPTISPTFTTTKDGNWTDAQTWGNLGVPGANDVVRVGHSVSISGHPKIAGLHVLSGGKVSGSGNSLTVNGDLVNEGIITQGFNFHLTMSGGTFVNKGTINSYFLMFMGNKKISFLIEKPLENVSTTFVSTGTSFELEGCAEFSGKEFAETGIGGYTTINKPSVITINNFGGADNLHGDGVLKILGSARSSFSLLGDIETIAFAGKSPQNLPLRQVSAKTVYFMGDGAKKIDQTGTITGNVVIAPGTTLQTLSRSVSTSIIGDIENYGTIQDGTTGTGNQPFTLKVSGNILNEGQWNHNSTRILENLQDDKSIEGLEKFSGTLAFEGYSRLSNTPTFGGTVSSGANAVIAFSSDLTESSLPVPVFTLMGNYGGNLKIEGRGEIHFTGANQNIGGVLTAEKIIMGGTGTKILDTLSITGDLFIKENVGIRNDPTNNERLTIFGNVINNGIFYNGNNWDLFIDISGNIQTGATGAWMNGSTQVFFLPHATASLFQIQFTENNSDVWMPILSVAPNKGKVSYPITTMVKNKEVRKWRHREFIDGIWQGWSKPILINQKNNTPPNIEIIGENPIFIVQETDFADSGAVASDNEDGDITANILTSFTYTDTSTELPIPLPADSVDTELTGEFVITYSVTDSGGLQAEKTRTVVVLPLPTLEFSEEENFKNAEGEATGADREKATTNEEELTFKVVYTDESEPSAVNVKTVITEEIDFRTDAFEERLDFEGNSSCTPSKVKTNTLGNFFGCRNSGANVKGIGENEVLEIIIPSEEKEEFTLEVFPEENTSLQVKLTAFNSAGVEIAQSKQAIITQSGLTKISVKNRSGDIQKVAISTTNYVSGEIFIKSIFMTESFNMVVDPSALNTTLNDGSFANGEQFQTLQHFPKGKYNYFFTGNNGENLAVLPEEPLRFETGYSNIVFLPGLQASRLYRQEARDGICVNCENQLWEPNTNADVEKLFMEEAATGESIHSDIYTKDVVNEGLGVANIYLSFLEDLEKWKEQGVYNDFVTIPYDWRFDLDDILSRGIRIGDEISYNQPTDDPYVYKKIQEAIGSSANGKITIVTHSNGGLLAKKMFVNLQAENSQRARNILENTENLILVASPQLGTPKAVASLLHGEGQSYVGGIVLNKITARGLGAFMPGGYNLIPSAMYFDRVKEGTMSETLLEHASEDPVISEDMKLKTIVEQVLLGYPNIVSFHESLADISDQLANHFLSEYQKNITDENTLINFLTDTFAREPYNSANAQRPISLNRNMLADAKALHDEIDNWVPPENMRVVQVAGWGLNTLRGMEYVSKEVSECATYGSCKKVRIFDYKPLLTFDGDETVVTPSAIAMRNVPKGETYYVDMEEYNKSGFLNSKINRNHASILEISDIRNIVNRVVQNKPLDIREDANDTEYDSENFSYMTKAQPISTESYIRLALHSPVSIDVYDSKGNHIGLSTDANDSEIPTFDEEIPNSYYMEFGESKYVGFPANEEYAVVLKGLDNGTFTFEMEEVLGEEVIDTKVFIDIPTTPTMQAEIFVTTVGQSTPLSIDIDGDGKEDASTTGEEGEGSVSAHISILQKIVENTEIYKPFKKQILDQLISVQKDIVKEKLGRAILRIDQIIKSLQWEIEKNTKLSEKTDAYLANLLKQKEYFEKIIEEQFKKRFGKKWKKYWNDYQERWNKRIEIIKNRYKWWISAEDAQHIIFLLEGIKAKIENT